MRLVPVVVMLAAMWVVEIVDVPLDGRLDRFGVHPRRLSGLDGIVFGPFLHRGFGHLFANTLPFLILGAAIAIGSVRRWLTVSVIIALVSGFGVWLFAASNTVTVGASGLVFGYLSYLVTRGIFARKVLYLLGGLLALFVYGGILWGLVPHPGISWSGHIFGAVGGVLAAALVHRPRPEEPGI
ncbi:MAG: rhomboid family intramembrane serine protease [Acidimicrobiia bacterium]|nr:rhomboid family intramembrane serine protease [Acidimicrobiia bacterium]